LTYNNAQFLEARDAFTGQAIGKPVQRPGALNYYFLTLYGSADGKLAVLPSDDSRPQVWDLIEGKPLSPPLGAEAVSYISSAYFSPDGKRVVTNYGVLNAERIIALQCRLWETATGKPLGLSLPGTFRVAFSPDATTMLLLCESTSNPSQFKVRDLILWDVAAGRPRGERMHAEATVDAMAFSPDGRHAWTGRKGGKVQTWDTATGKLVGESTICPAPLIAALDCRPDGKLYLENFNDSSKPGLKIRDAATGMQVGKPIPIRYSIQSFACSPDGKSVAVVSFGGSVEVCRLPEPVAGSAERLTLWVQVLTGMELGDDGTTHLLDADTWKQRHQRLQELGGPPLP
jgi:WD40 repeat protein